MRRVLDLFASGALIAALLVAWEVACRVLAVPVYVLPPPSQVAMAVAGDAPGLALAAWRTLSRALLALAFCSVTATALALLVALSPLLERAVKPLAVAVQVTPIIAIAPLVVIWTGIENTERAIVILAAVVAFFPVFSGALTGLKSADPDLERLFDLYGAGRLQRLLRLRLPAAVPFMLEGHKVAAGQALIGAVFAEFVAKAGSSQGLAWRILLSASNLQMPRMFAGLFALILMGGLLYAGLQVFERSALRWWRGR
jgi:NitT/TauT family transport system permease protein